MNLIRLGVLSSILLTALTSTGYARCNNHSILCPTIDAIHQAAPLVDSAEFVNGAYIAGTPPAVIHTKDFDWFAVVFNIQAGSKNEAILAGQRAMQSASEVSGRYAKSAGCIYHCEYDSGKIKVVNNEPDY